MILDASALLTLLFNEPGADEVRAVMRDAKMSAVSVAEVAAKLADRGLPESAARQALEIGFDTIPFDGDRAAIVAKLYRKTKKHGLSLEDRCCLATAIKEKEPVLTADSTWSKISVSGLNIVVIKQSR